MVSQFSTIVLVVASSDGDNSSVAHLTKVDDFEGDRKSLVGSPVGRQHGTDEIWAACTHELSGVLREDFGQGPFPEHVVGELLVVVVMVVGIRCGSGRHVECGGGESSGGGCDGLLRLHGSGWSSLIRGKMHKSKRQVVAVCSHHFRSGGFHWVWVR